MKFGKTVRKIGVIVMCMCMLACMLAGCGNEGGSSAKGDREVIEVKLWRSGLGEEWMKKMIEAFEEEFPQYEVILQSSADVAGLISALGNEEIDTTDLYFTIDMSPENVSMDAVLDSKAKGESKTIREKMRAAFLENVTYEDGTVTALPFGGGVIGIVYNKKLFEDNGIKELPRTTKELSVVCNQLARNNVKAWCHFKQGGYWDMMLDVFAMQYDGAEYRRDVFYACTDEQGNSPSKDVLTRKDGRYYSLKEMETFLKTDYVLSGSNSADHITMQTRFMYKEAAMMVTGTWITNEMKSVGNMDDYGMMRTPVVSSIINKLTSVKKDSELSNVVKAIDMVVDGKKQIEDYKQGNEYVIGNLKVTSEDWDYIYNARNTVGVNYTGCTVFIPNYSEQVEGAQEFLRFMYSDVGLKIYEKETGAQLPLELDQGEYDESQYNDFQKETVKLLETSSQHATSYIAKKHPIFEDGGMINNMANKMYVQYLCATNSGDLKSADKIWSEIINTINKDYEEVWLKNIK